MVRKRKPNDPRGKWAKEMKRYFTVEDIQFYWSLAKCKSRLGLLAVERLRFYASNAGNTSSIPGQGTRELGSHVPCGTTQKKTNQDHNYSSFFHPFDWQNLKPNSKYKRGCKSRCLLYIASSFNHSEKQLGT